MVMGNGNMKSVIAAGFAAALTMSGTATVRFVRPGGSGTGGSTTWATAFPNLYDALNSGTVVSGDTLYVAASTYKPPNQSSSFVLKQGVIVLGGFPNNGTANLIGPLLSHPLGVIFSLQ